MTHPLPDFKVFTAFVAICLLTVTNTGCTERSKSSEATQVQNRLQTLSEQSRILEEQAFAIESQIDEIRRSDNSNQATEIEKLHTQFRMLKATHAKMEQQMVLLRKELHHTSTSFQSP